MANAARRERPGQHEKRIKTQDVNRGNGRCRTNQQGRQDMMGTIRNADSHKCHGEQGKGDGPTTKTIKSMKMTDWTDHAAMAKYTDEDLFKIIKEGGAAANKSKIMPAYKGKLSDEEIRGLVGFIRSLAKK